jgi:hypothetical protein
MSPAESPAVALREKPAGKEETTEPPPCVIYPKRGKGNAQSKPGKRHGLATKENGFGSRLCEGKVLAPLRIRRTRRDPRTIGRKMVAKHCSHTHTLAEGDTRKQTRLTRQDIASWAYLVYQA